MHNSQCYSQDKMCDDYDTSNRQPYNMSENGAESENEETGIHNDKCTNCARMQTQHEKLISENQ